MEIDRAQEAGLGRVRMYPAKSQQIVGILVFKQFLFVLGRTGIRRARLFRYNQSCYLQDVIFLQRRKAVSDLWRELYVTSYQSSS